MFSQETFSNVVWTFLVQHEVNFYRFGTTFTLQSNSPLYLLNKLSGTDQTIIFLGLGSFAFYWHKR